MDKPIKDWAGNEIKEGMIILFLRTKPFNLGKIEFVVPVGKSGKPEHMWENEELYQKRINEDVWELSEEYEVKRSPTGRLYVTVIEKGRGDLDGYTFTESTYLDDTFFGEKKMAIKGLSDKQQTPKK